MTSLEFHLHTNVAHRLVRLAHRCMDGAMEQYGLSHNGHASSDDATEE
jgi:hypothetical protein